MRTSIIKTVFSNNAVQVALSIFLTFLLMGVFFASNVSSAVVPTTIVSWDFEDQNVNADVAIPVNSDKTIRAVGTREIGYVGTNKAITASGWVLDDVVQEKYWEIEFITTGYELIGISFDQSSSGTGPKEFVLQYRVGSGDWSKVTNISISPEGWFSLSDISIPMDASDVESVSVRWLSTDVKAGSAGTNRIDNIVVTGTAIPVDADSDGVSDDDDNCPAIVNPDQMNTDGDDMGDMCDADDDNDGVLDDSDSDSTNPNECEDIDNDTADDCAVGVDGFGPLVDNTPNNDGLDSDGDGMADSGDNCPTVANSDQADENKDGVGNVCESEMSEDSESEDEELVLPINDVVKRSGGGSLMKTTTDRNPSSDESDDTKTPNTRTEEEGDDEESEESESPTGDVRGAQASQFLSDLSQGMKSEEVRALQEYLLSLGFFTFPTATGYFGPITLQAVQAFQRHHNLPDTGYVGPLTREKLHLGSSQGGKTPLSMSFEEMVELFVTKGIIPIDRKVKALEIVALQK